MSTISCSNCKNLVRNEAGPYRTPAPNSEFYQWDECWAMDDVTGVLLDPEYIDVDKHFCALHSNQHAIEQMRMEIPSTAAPELLEALEWLVSIQFLAGAPEAMHKLTYQEAVEQAEAAIAKAKGEQQ